MENKAKLPPGIVLGTQYYRAPTPLPDEWAGDLAEIAHLGLEAVQIRVQWRWNERAEGQYEFADVDRLFDLAEERGLKVIFKFLMECAPDYIFRKYGGTRCDMHGAPLRPGAIGAYYAGGWMPCFDNPAVMEKARAFVRVCAERYRDRASLLLWNVWNEPTARPLAECGCAHSTRSYQEWLRAGYGTITALNQRFGKCWEDFATVEPPAMPGDYAELFLWRKWSLDSVRRRVAFMVAELRPLAGTRPIISHVGCCSVIQDVAGNGADDFANANEVDFYGTSWPTAVHFRDAADEAFPFMIGDWLRHVRPYWWAYEVYPDWGGWNRRASAADFKLKVWSALACGAKGILYWQYRAERVGNEGDLAGLADIDGRPRAVTAESRRIALAVKKHERLFAAARVRDDGIGLLYSLDSDLINRVENTGGESFWSFELRGGQPYLYKKALWGMYGLLRNLGIAPRWVDSRKLAQELPQLKLLYLPEAFMLSEEEIGQIAAYARAGGRLIAEEGIGLRDAVTWVRPSWPPRALADIFGGRGAERVAVENEKDVLSMGKRKIAPGGFMSYLEPSSGKIIGRWRDGRPGALRNGNAVWLGTSLGVSWYEALKGRRSGKNAGADQEAVLGAILGSLGLPPRASARGLCVRDLDSGNATLRFAFNRRRTTQRMILASGEELLALISAGVKAKKLKGKTVLEIAPRDVGVWAQSAPAPG